MYTHSERAQVALPMLDQLGALSNTGNDQVSPSLFEVAAAESSAGRISVPSCTLKDARDGSYFCEGSNSGSAARCRSASSHVWLCSLLMYELTVLSAPVAVAMRLTKTAVQQRATDILEQIDRFLSDALALGVGTLPAPRYRSMLLDYARTKMLLHTLTRRARTADLEISILLGRFLRHYIRLQLMILLPPLDTAANLTLERELEDILHSKGTTKIPSTTSSWPHLSDIDDEASVDAGEVVDALAAYWLDVSQHRKRQRKFEAPFLQPLWTVVNISLATTNDALLMARYSSHGEQYCFRLPLDRLGRREDEDEDELLTFSVAEQELGEIVALSNAAAQQAKYVQTADARAEWWAERKDLDQRMQTLQARIQSRWLGGFKVPFPGPLSRYLLIQNAGSALNGAVVEAEATCNLQSESRDHTQACNTFPSRKQSGKAGARTGRRFCPLRSSYNVRG